MRELNPLEVNIREFGDFRILLGRMCVLLEQVLTQLEKELSISQTMILSIAVRFQEHMEQGLSGLESSLKMFPSYLQAPRGYETGTFLALDLGGSNARAAIVELKGAGNFLELHKLSRPLSDSASGYDYRAASVTAEELFDFLAGIIHEVLRKVVTVSLITAVGNTTQPSPRRTRAAESK